MHSDKEPNSFKGEFKNYTIVTLKFSFKPLPLPSLKFKGSECLQFNN
jgi:hypothetical protein